MTRVRDIKDMEKKINDVYSDISSSKNEVIELEAHINMSNCDIEDIEALLANAKKERNESIEESMVQLESMNDELYIMVNGTQPPEKAFKRPRPDTEQKLERFGVSG